MASGALGAGREFRSSDDDDDDRPMVMSGGGNGGERDMREKIKIHQMELEQLTQLQKFSPYKTGDHFHQAHVAKCFPKGKIKKDVRAALRVRTLASRSKFPTDDLEQQFFAIPNPAGHHFPFIAAGNFGEDLVLGKKIKGGAAGRTSHLKLLLPVFD